MTHPIPAPGHGALEGAVETHEPGSSEPAAAPRICATCAWWSRLLSPSGHCGICHEKWRGLKWNDAVPLAMSSETCDKHEPRTPTLTQPPSSSET